jgi:hypothetical protein
MFPVCSLQVVAWLVFFLTATSTSTWRGTSWSAACGWPFRHVTSMLHMLLEVWLLSLCLLLGTRKMYFLYSVLCVTRTWGHSIVQVDKVLSARSVVSVLVCSFQLQCGGLYLKWKVYQESSWVYRVTSRYIRLTASPLSLSWLSSRSGSLDMSNLWVSMAFYKVT